MESDMEFNFVIEDLKQELSRLEEENRVLRSSSNESRHSVHDVLQEDAQAEVEGSRLDSENQEYKNEGLELAAEVELLKAQMEVAHDTHARVEAETVALKQGKEDEVSRLSSQIMTLEGQLHELKEEHTSVLVKSKDLESNLEIIDDEKMKLKDQVASILEYRQKREDELVGMLESCQEHVRTMEVEQQNLLSTIETSDAAVRQLEGQNAALSSKFEEQKKIADNKIADLASELQITQEQQHELHLHVQGLREENTHVVTKASKLDQDVEELKSDKLRLSSDLERLVQEREKKEEELETELRTCREHVQSLEAEKLASVTLVDNLIAQVRELEEDNRQLTALSNEASQSVQHLWEENIRLINRLEQEKHLHEGERMELVAGIQTVREQLHAANEREALLVADLRGLHERRDAEEVLFGQRVKDLELKLEVSEEDKSDVISKSEEISQVLESLKQETSQTLQDLRDEKDQLVQKVSALVNLKEETEQAISVKQTSWETQVRDLESEKSAVMFMAEDLERQLHASREEVKDLKEKVEKSNQLILELRDEITRLSGEIDKLEEVKERQEGERLELAAELQAAWDQIHSVRSSESNLATELNELKELRNEEKLSSDEQVQELRQQLQELEERSSEAGSKVEQLSKRLNELRKEQELQDENEQLEAKIVMMEEEKGVILTEKAVLLGEVQTLKDRVESLELDKNKMAFEIEELNHWLQGPATEKKQLAANLDEMTLLLKGLELERTQLTTSVNELQEEKEKMQKDASRLQDAIKVLEEEKAKSLLVHEDFIRQLESLEEEKQQALRIQEESALLVQDLNEKIHVLKEESTRITSLHDDSLLQIQSLEEKKTAMDALLEEQSVGLNQLHLENAEHVDALGKLEEELQLRQAEVQILKSQVSSLEEESLSMKSLHEIAHSQLQAMDIAKSQAEKSLVSIGEENTQLRQSLEESEHRMQGLIQRNSELSDTVSRLEEELVKRSEEIQIMSGRLSDLVEEKETSLSQHKDLLDSLQAENLEHINKAVSLDDAIERSQAQVERLEEQIESLSTLHRDTHLQLQASTEENVGLTKALDALNSSVQHLQAENLEHISKAESAEQELERRQGEIQGYQDTLLQLQTLEEEKAELVKSLDASNLSVKELQEENVQHSERVKFLEEEVARKQAEVQSLTVETESLSTAYDDSLLHVQGLKVEKSAITNQLQECQGLVQKLHTENSELASAARKFQELCGRWDKIESLDCPVHSLDDKDFREASEYPDVPLQVKAFEGAAEPARSLEGCNGLVKCLKMLEQSELMVKKLQLENMELSTTVTKLEKHLHDESQTFRVQVQSLEVERESFEQECTAKLRSLEEEKFQLAKALEELNLAVADLNAAIDTLKASVLDLGRGKDELANQMSLLQEQTCVIVAQRDQLLCEVQGVKEQLQEYVERLRESENDAKISKGEALELAKQLENAREQATRVEENLSLSSQLGVPNQLGSTPVRSGDIMMELESDLDRHRMSFGQMELSHLIDPREELQQASLGWVEIITTVCQELAKLLRSVGEEKEKLVRKQGRSHQKTEVLTNLCQELDRLILGVREKTERFAEELSLLKHKLVESKNERFSVGSDGDLNVGNYQQLPTVVAPENRESMLDMETSCQTLQSPQVGKTQLEAHVANLSSRLADSQGQLKALVFKSSTGNPYLLTSRADDGSHRKGLACFSADDNGVVNYGSELGAGGNIKSLEQERKEKKGNVTPPSFTQRTQSSGRSFKKCKVSMQQPKRRWIF